MSGDHAVLSQKIPIAHQGNRRFFSVRGGDSHFQLSLLHVKNRVGRVALRVGRLIFFQAENFLPNPALARKVSGSKTVSPFPGCGLGVGSREDFEISPVAGLADRTGSTGGTRSAGRAWRRVGMPLALISYRRRGSAYTSTLYILEAGGLHVPGQYWTDCSGLDLSSSSEIWGLKRKCRAEGEQSWTHRPVSAGVNGAANHSALKLNCASTKKLAEAAQDRRAPDIMTPSAYAGPVPPREEAPIAAAC